MNRIRCHVVYPTRAKVEPRAVALAGKGIISPWTPEEDLVLRKNFPAMRAEDVGALIKRTAFAVQSRAALLGVEKDPKFRRQLRETNRYATYQASLT